jgi:hypothetical protein
MMAQPPTISGWRPIRGLSAIRPAGKLSTSRIIAGAESSAPAPDAPMPSSMARPGSTGAMQP